MSKYLLSFLTYILIFSSCSTDFELEAPWKDIPIVYAFISIQDTAHYIRIEKAFLEPGGDANAIAQIADSLYYDDNLVVELEKGSNARRYALQRVDGNLEGYQRREEGPFANSPNYLYKIKADQINLTGGEELRLLINRGENLDLVSAETIVLDEIFIRESNPASPLNLAYDRNINFVFNVGDAAQLFDVRLLIYYDEEIGGVRTRKELVWTLTKDQVRSSDQSRIAVGILGEDFYRFLGASLDENAQARRFFQRIDVLISAGGQEMVDLLSVQEANIGITSSQLIPNYTNLSEGRGVFTSRSIGLRTGLSLNSISTDSLKEGIYTRDLNFQ